MFQVNDPDTSYRFSSPFYVSSGLTMSWSKSVSDSQRLRRAKEGVYGVENALRAFSTPYTQSGERRRREQALVMGIRHTLSQSVREKAGSSCLFCVGKAIFCDAIVSAQRLFSMYTGSVRRRCGVGKRKEQKQLHDG